MTSHAPAALTLQQYLDRGYAHDSGLSVSSTDPAVDLAQSGIPAATLQARLGELLVVADRDVISRLQSGVLRRALSQIG